MKTAVKALISRLALNDASVEFKEVMKIISTYYHYQPSLFSNGDVVNQAGTNEGSCKIFAFAKLHGLSEHATLNCFGQYYREDVLAHPQGSDHANIRSFMQKGWQGVLFEKAVLKPKTRLNK